jgi:hypothetical protein
MAPAIESYTSELNLFLIRKVLNVYHNPMDTEMKTLQLADVNKLKTARKH